MHNINWKVLKLIQEQGRHTAVVLLCSVLLLHNKIFVSDVQMYSSSIVPLNHQLNNPSGTRFTSIQVFSNSRCFVTFPLHQNWRRCTFQDASAVSCNATSTNRFKNQICYTSCTSKALLPFVVRMSTWLRITAFHFSSITDVFWPYVPEQKSATLLLVLRIFERVENFHTQRTNDVIR